MILPCSTTSSPPYQVHCGLSWSSISTRSARRPPPSPPISPSMPKRVAPCSEPIDHACSGDIPAFTASRTTQSRPNSRRSSASRSSVHTAVRLCDAPSSVTVRIACGSECQGVVGGPPRRKTQTPASSRSSAMSTTGYEKLLYDCMVGDASLFHRSDMVEAAWEAASPILEAWNNNPPTDFPNYASGTWGPEAATQLIGRDKHHWWTHS